MSFFDEAREAREKRLATQSVLHKNNDKATARVINEYFKTLSQDAYREMRNNALKDYEESGKLVGIRYDLVVELSWSVTHCDTARVEEYMKGAVRSAFFKLCDELNARKHLKAYTTGVSIYRYEVREGYRIITRHHDYRCDNGEYDDPYSFEVSLNSRFTPPLR